MASTRRLSICRRCGAGPVDVEAIRCPAFVSCGEGDFAEATTEAFFGRQPNPNKRLVRAEGSGGHCEGMGPTRKYADIFGWLRDLWP
jgi:hypothetical protein